MVSAQQRSCCGRLAELKGSFASWQRRGEKPAMGLRRLCRAGLCACGANILGGIAAIRQPVAKPAWLASMKRKDGKIGRAHV